MRQTGFAYAIRAVLTVTLVAAGQGDRVAAADPAYAATFGAVALPRMVAGSLLTVDVPVTNSGTATWTSDTATGPVALSYHWYGADGSLVTWDGARSAIGTAIRPGETRRIAAALRAPASPGSFVLAIDMVREGIAWFASPIRMEARIDAATDAAAYAVGAGASAWPDQRLSMPITVVNIGTTMWPSVGFGSVLLAYHVYAAGQLVVWDGIRTSLGGDVAPGQSRSVALEVIAPHLPGAYSVRVDLVREGIAWFSSRGSAAAATSLRVQSNLAASYDSWDMPAGAPPGATVRGTVSITNVGTTTWTAAGTSPTRLSYHVRSTARGVVVWDGLRSALPRDVPPGASVSVPASLQAPAAVGAYVVEWDLVREGASWFSSTGTPPARQDLSVLPASLVGAEWSQIPAAGMRVALTFDCGGNDAGVAAILSTLARADAPATFFLTGRWAETYPVSTRAIAARYPIGDHSYSHPHLTQLSDSGVEAEVRQGAASLARVTGADPHPLFRFPYGESDARTIAVVNRLGYGGIRWTLDTLGWQGSATGHSSDTVVARIIGGLRPGAIILMHVGAAEDGSTLDADALARVITEIRARGYELVTLRDFLW